MSRGNHTGKGGFADNPKNINNKGRPMNATTWAGVMREAAKEIAGNSEITKKEAIVKILFAKAGKGDLAAIKMIMDRMDGLPTAFVESKNDNVIEHKIEVIGSDGETLRLDQINED